VAEPEKDPREAKWELINTEQAARLGRQDQSLARIETKAGVITAFALAAGQFLATRHPFATPLSTLFGILAFACYVITAGCSIWITRVARGSDLNAGDLVNDAQNEALTRADLLKQLIVTRAEVYKNNNRQNTKRAHVWWVSVGSLSAGFASSVVCVMLTT
jgi:hypothetical protein